MARLPQGVTRPIDREADARAIEEFLAKGNKIVQIPDSRDLIKARKARERREKVGAISIFSEADVYCGDYK